MQRIGPCIAFYAAAWCLSVRASIATKVCTSVKTTLRQWWHDIRLITNSRQVNGCQHGRRQRDGRGGQECPGSLRGVIFLTAGSKGRYRGNQILAEICENLTKMAIPSLVCDIGLSLQSLVLRERFSYQRIHLWHSRTQGTKGRYHCNQFWN